METAADVKKRVSFLGIYFGYDKFNQTEWNYLGIKSHMNQLTTVLLRQQNKLRSIMRKEDDYYNQLIDTTEKKISDVKNIRMSEVKE